MVMPSVESIVIIYLIPDRVTRYHPTELILTLSLDLYS